MGRQKSESIKINFIFNIIYQVINVLSPLVVTPKISRVFGLNYIGIKSYTFSVVYYFAIFGVLGLDMLGQRRIALVKDDLDKRSKEFWTIYLTRFMLVLTSSCLYIGYAFTALLSSIERTVTFIWIIYLIREMINPVWFLQGLEKYRQISIMEIISQLTYVTFTIVFVKNKSDLPLYILFYTAIPLLVSLSYIPMVVKNVLWHRPVIDEMVAALKESVIYFIPTIAAAVYSMVDKTMLGMFDKQKISTGLYESSERLVKVALALSTASFTIMRTRMTYIYGQKNAANYRTMCRLFISFSMMLCWPIMFGVIGISKDFVPVFFGQGFEEVVGLSYVFSLVVPCLTISGLLQAIYIFPYGLQKTMDVYYVIIVISNIIMNIILISMMGTLGAIIASVSAELLLAVILLIRARKDIDVLYIARCSFKYIVSATAMLIIMKMVSNIKLASRIVRLLIEFLCAVLSYFATCILLKDNFVLEQTKKILARIIRNPKEL